MKKIIIFVTVIILVINSISNNNVVIPEQAIRFRIIANSNSLEDQKLKKEVVKNLTSDILKISNSSNDIEEIRYNIQKQLPSIKNTISKTLVENNVPLEYEINYGINYFPEKEYKGITYDDGNYESVVIKLGDGAGENFWCVLFPPLCLLEVEEQEEKNVEYTSFIKEIIDKYF